MAGWTPLPLSHAHTGSTSVSAYPGESPPVHLVAADDVALSAYYLSRSQGGQEVYTWSLYDPTSGTYRHTPYQQLDVAPGLGLAAVLERAAGSDRIGILDMATWQVMRWIPVPAGDPVGSVRFSPDGTKLVATVFDGNAATRDASVRGIIVIDLVAGTLGIQPLGHPAPGMGPNVGARWTADGAYIYLHWQDDLTGLGLQFYTPDGTPVPDPPRADVIATIWGGGVSPDGTLYADPNSASPTAVKKLATGRVEGHQPLENIQAWADNRAVIGDYCGPGCHSEFQTHLALTSTDGTAVTVLTGTQTGNDSSPQQWEPVFTRR